MGVISRRYARALYQAAEESAELDAVRRAVGALAAALADPEIRSFLLERERDRAQKRALLVEALEGSPEIFLNFLRLVFDRGNEDLLLELGREFENLDLHALGEARARLEVAREIQPQELEAIRAKTEAIFGVKIRLAVEQKPDLIGGFRMTVANQRIDASVEARLRGLKESMSGVSMG